MFIFKLTLRILINIVFLGSPLFLAAGTLAWGRAWVFLGVYFMGAVAMLVSLSGRQDLLDERLKPPLQHEQPVSDKLVLLLFIVAFVGLLVFTALDVFRLHLLGQPGLIVSACGLLLVGVGLGLIFLSLKENAFAAPVVKDQAERHQTVIDTGVYALVRHPLYAGFVLLLVGLPLWLESYAATVFASVPSGLLAVRIVGEEQFLRRELHDYDAYTKKVPYRLIPFVW